MKYAMFKGMADGIIVFDGNECSFDVVKEQLVNENVSFQAAEFDDFGAARSPCAHLLNNEPLVTGQVIPYKNGNVVTGDVYKVCMFMDTAGTYGLIQQEATDCIVENNKLDMPFKLQTGNGIANLGDYVAIRPDGTTFVTSLNDWDLF
ncbi:hypothetical protein [Vibrio natriegens]|uniref:hypothetical protein n=1 Tax=Vibrio natriegens TaxID=691 RepID=UPI000804327F|nr:hypothetical protein [Vibrio natriegens]ANQ17550.1 hypothetical protein BA891_10045 [Vibrio natriegens]